MKVFVRALARWSWVLILCLLIGWFGGKKVAALIPPQYQATAIIQLNAQSHSSSIVQPIAAYGTLVTSDSVLGTALKKYPNLDRQAIISKQLTVSPDTSSQTISIQVTLPNAKEAADLANDLGNLLVLQQNAYIKQQYNTELQLLDNRIAGEQQSIDTLNKKIIQLSATPTLATANATAIQQDQSQVSQYQNLQNQDLTQRQTLLTQQALYSDPLSLVQQAIPPTKPSSILGIIPVASLFLGLMLILGVLAIFFLERKADHINGTYILQKKVGLPVLGSLRWIRPSPQNIPLHTLIDSKMPYAEDCRIMMADVLFHAEEAQAHILAITGTKAQSGSSTIASELAALLAKSRRRVLLIDANLHEPAQHKRLEIPNEMGLANMLEDARNLNFAPDVYVYHEPIDTREQGTISMMETRRITGVPNQALIPTVKPQSPSPNRMEKGANGTSGQKIVEIAEKFPFDNYVITTSIPNLYALPAGKTTLNPSSLLSMPVMDQFLEWSSKRANFIVIDCPALIHAEAHVLGSLSNQTFLVVDATRDQLKQVADVKEELMNTGVKLSGLIVNKLGRWI